MQACDTESVTGAQRHASTCDRIVAAAKEFFEASGIRGTSLEQRSR